MRALLRRSIPHAQDQPPGPALSPQEAIAKMTVPEGFTVELVASEPDIVNPVAMTFDERGRIWITESLEYPRSEPGPGRDRVKVLEDTDGDGKADKFTDLRRGAEHPLGHRRRPRRRLGRQLARHPLLSRTPTATARPTSREVVVTGFGRDDTHELPNSLTWGPDGWLYGWNGVFNPSHVKSPNGKDLRHSPAPSSASTRGPASSSSSARGRATPGASPSTTKGGAFVSACVIDHLWHLTETGYYHRQGGPYPPFTWKIDSIVKHKHQKAAYCGIHYFDSDAYPEQYRDKLYMGNIHGNCINVDALERDGSTYFATPRARLPHGQRRLVHARRRRRPAPTAACTSSTGTTATTATRTPTATRRASTASRAGSTASATRTRRGREAFDLAKESDERLFERLQGNNGFLRDTAMCQLMQRRSSATIAKTAELLIAR